MTSQVSTPDMAPAWSPEPERRTRTEMRSHQVLNRDGLTLHARSAQRYDRDILAAGVIEMLDALHIDQYVLVGHSLGGDFAAGIALRFSERVVALGLVDIGPELRAPGLRRVRELTMRAVIPSDEKARFRLHIAAHICSGHQCLLRKLTLTALKPHATHIDECVVCESMRTIKLREMREVRDGKRCLSRAQRRPSVRVMRPHQAITTLGIGDGLRRLALADHRVQTRDRIRMHTTSMKHAARIEKRRTSLG